MSIDRKVKNLIQRELIIFDFDETLVDCNSDTWIHRLAPDEKIPKDLEYQEGQDYFKYVQSVVNYLQNSVGVSELDYINCLAKMPVVSGMIESLIVKLGEATASQDDEKKERKYDMIILSDANSFFINTFLKIHKLEEYFPTVLTNQAKFNEDGQLVLNEFHVQDYCSLSARNLCKGEALKNYIGKRMLDHNTVYSCINYVGDGENDLCPSTKLSSRDRIFPRAGYPLDDLCLKLTEYDCNGNQSSFEKLPELKAPIYPWSSGADIYNVIVGNKN